MNNVNFILETTYGLLITALPFILITLFNLLILRKLLNRSFGIKHKTKVVFKENRGRLEFTVILLSISTCFVLLNVPYFIFWCIQFLVTSSVPDNMADVNNSSKSTFTIATSNEVYITRTIFYLNYAINFFLYCFSTVSRRNTSVEINKTKTYSDTSENV